MTTSGEVFLNPGDFCFADGEIRLRTLLGSCVSITLWHRRTHIGGMCHFMNPSRGQQSDVEELDGRYADEAVEMFLRELNRHGTRPQEYEVQMFGGGNQFPDTPTPAALDVSRGNVAAGLRLLRQHGFTLTTVHLGGTGYRRVEFDLTTGAVRMTHVDHADAGRTT